MLLPFIFVWPVFSSSSVIIVTTEQDIFDGDTHSPQSLKQFPGRDGAISLREAIETANQSSEQVTIIFQPKHETMTLRFDSPLPPIRESLIIDGTTSPSHQIMLQGKGNKTGRKIDGLILESNGSIIRGLTITNFSGNGIIVRGHDNRLEGNYVGTNSSGTPDIGNGLNGVLVLGNSNQIGGSSHPARNVISGNLGHGIAIQKGTQNHIAGNLIGVHPTNDLALPNAKDGILIAGAHNIIGGITPLESNIVSGNGKNGIHLIASAHHTRIQGNIVGIQSSLRHLLPNQEDGIFVKSQDNLIGGRETGAGNIIGGNLQSGIEIHQGHNNRIQGNFIGTDKDGKLEWGNQLEGIVIFANNTQIGGKKTHTYNLIAFNKRGGVAIPFGQRNTVQGNAIYQNEGLAINLQQDQLTPNDSLDQDNGPNGLQNFPVLSIATARSSDDLFVMGELESRPTQTYELDFYAGKPDGPLRYQEAFAYLGSETVTTNAKGETRFSLHLPIGTSPGRYLTATATNSEGNTSELAQSILVNQPNPQIIWKEKDTSAQGQPIFHTSYSEGMAPVGILPATIKIRDVDSPQLAQLTVTLNNLLDGEMEEITANNLSEPLSQSYVHGTLTITGNAPLAIYEEALHALTYQNLSPAPTTAPRALTIVASDGEFMSQPFTTQIQVGGVNTPPILTWRTTSSAKASTRYRVTFTEGDAPIHVLPDTVKLTDLDSPQLTQLTVTIDSLLDGKQEILHAHLTDPTLKQTVKGKLLTISGSASVETYQAILRSLTYENRSSAPAVTPRIITVLASDGMLTSQPFTTRVTINDVNTPPTLTLPQFSSTTTLRTYTTSYREGTNPTPLLPTGTILTDLDSETLNQLTITLKNPLDGAHEILDVNLKDFSLRKIFQQGTLTISGSASVETYQAILRSVTYENRSVAPSTTPRLFSIVASDKTLSSTPYRTQVNLVAHNTPPSLTISQLTSESPLTFTEGDDSMALLTSHSQIQDQDSSTFRELNVVLTNPVDHNHEILSVQLPDSGLTQSYHHGTLTVKGEASKTVYESVLHSLAYLNKQNPPQEGNRDLVLSIRDSQGGVSQPQKITILVQAQPQVQEPFAKPFIASLDSVAENVKTEAQEQQAAKQLVVKTVTGSSLMVTAGLLIWVLRGTSLLASMWATIPAWNSIDPLPILGMSQEERMQELIDTQHIEEQEQQEFPQMQKIFSQQHTAHPLTDKDPPQS